MTLLSAPSSISFEAGDLKGAIVDIVSVVGNLRQSYSRLEDLFVSVKNKNDVEEIEVFLSDEKKRNEFYDSLSD